MLTQAGSPKKDATDANCPTVSIGGGVTPIGLIEDPIVGMSLPRIAPDAAGAQAKAWSTVGETTTGPLVVRTLSDRDLLRITAAPNVEKVGAFLGDRVVVYDLSADRSATPPISSQVSL